MSTSPTAGRVPIPTLPPGTYQGALEYPTDRLLSWEHSEHVKVTGAPDQWMDEMIKAERRLRSAREYLTEVVGEPIFPDEAKNSKVVTQGVTLARKEIFPFQVWDPNSNRLPENEVPRFNPDGTMYAEDVNKIGVAGDGEPILNANKRLHPRPGANTHLETILYRLPKQDVKGLGHQAALDALTATEEVSRRLSWNEGRNQIPNVQYAIDEIDRMLGNLEKARQGPDAAKGGPLSKAAAWFGGQPAPIKVAIVAAGLVGVGVAGYEAFN